MLSSGLLRFRAQAPLPKSPQHRQRRGNPDRSEPQTPLWLAPKENKQRRGPRQPTGNARACADGRMRYRGVCLMRGSLLFGGLVHCSRTCGSAAADEDLSREGKPEDPSRSSQRTSLRSAQRISLGVLPAHKARAPRNRCIAKAITGTLSLAHLAHITTPLDRFAEVATLAPTTAEDPFYSSTTTSPMQSAAAMVGA